MIERAHGWLRAMDPILLLTRASLLALLVNANGDGVLFAGIAVVCVAALPRPAVLGSPILWAGLFVAVGLRQLATWHSVDDHVIVTTYWCAALALGLGADDPRRTLAGAARLLVAAVFTYAAGWKLLSGEFSDGSFFRYSLLLDDRFEAVARVVGGTDSSMRAANLEGIDRLAADPGSASLQLIEGPRNEALAQVFTWWGILIEAAVATAFLVLWRARWEGLRHGALLAFVCTTYLVVPVGGFGTLLLVLGSAQATSDRLRVGYVWGTVGFMAWAALWPAVFL